MAVCLVRAHCAGKLKKNWGLTWMAQKKSWNIFRDHHKMIQSESK